MAGYFDQMIEDFKELNGGQEDEFIKELLARRDEIGSDASEYDVLSAVHACLKAHLAEEIARAAQEEEEEAPDAPDEQEETRAGRAVEEAFADLLEQNKARIRRAEEKAFAGLLEEDEARMRRAEEKAFAGLLEEDEARMRRAAATIRQFLDGHRWRYSALAVQSGFLCYQFGLRCEGVDLWMRVHITADPCVCRIDASFPLLVNPAYEYPLCRALAEANRPLPFGSFKYDERRGSVSYQYSFLAGQGIPEDDFKIYFNEIVDSAVSCHDAICKCCFGQFESDEVGEILKKVNTLVSEIGE